MSTLDGMENQILSLLGPKGVTNMALMLTLMLIYATAFLPWIVFRNLFPAIFRNGSTMTAVVTVVQIAHLLRLWYNKGYLSDCRWLSLPFRRLLLPTVNLSFRLSANGEAMYWQVPPTAPQDNRSKSPGFNNDTKVVLQSFRKSVRRRHKQMTETFRSSGLRRQSVNAETDLNLSEFFNVLWQHEKRAVQRDATKGIFVRTLIHSLVRFAFVTVVSDGILDLIYDQQSQLVGFQMFFQSGEVIHCFMYFAADSATKSGIWWQVHLLGMVRGVALSPSGVKYVNAHVNHVQTKINAGFQPAKPTDKIMADLFPFCFGNPIPENVVKIALEVED
jgi:hypothetical protein